LQRVKYKTFPYVFTIQLMRFHYEAQTTQGKKINERFEVFRCFKITVLNPVYLATEA
jgi:hypothetical protein